MREPTIHVFEPDVTRFSKLNIPMCIKCNVILSLLLFIHIKLVDRRSPTIARETALNTTLNALVRLVKEARLR